MSMEDHSPGCKNRSSYSERSLIHYAQIFGSRDCPKPPRQEWQKCVASLIERRLFLFSWLRIFVAVELFSHATL